jgi:biotin carboxyl carrier protein
MTRLRVTDRATGEVLAEVESPGLDDTPGVDPTPGVDATGDPEPGELPIVLPAARPSGARGRIALEVVVAGWRFELEVEDADLAALRERATSSREAAIHHGPTEVRAIIPGRVVSVAVEAGDTVVAGQRLLAVEAMKMENELRSPRAGIVERVAAAVGQTVELGDPLVVIR